MNDRLRRERIMLIAFDSTRVAQASAVLLRLHANRMSRLRLLKLLYIADRECISETGRPITGDQVVAMENGPVLSRTYDLIKGRNIATNKWAKFIGNAGPVDVALVDDPGLGKLSKFEIAKLQDVANRFIDKDDWEVAEYTHTFAEWIKHKPHGKEKMNPISLDDVLGAVNMLQYKDALLAEERAMAARKKLLAFAAANA